jgi:hypothetical protein
MVWWRTGVLQRVMALHECGFGAVIVIAAIELVFKLIMKSSEMRFAV